MTGKPKLVPEVTNSELTELKVVARCPLANSQKAAIAPNFVGTQTEISLFSTRIPGCLLECPATELQWGEMYARQGTDRIVQVHGKERIGIRKSKLVRAPGTYPTKVRL